MGDKDLGEVPLSYVVGVFASEDEAKEAYDGLKELNKTDDYHVAEAAWLSKSADGKVKVHEKGDLRGGQGAVRGGLIGGVVGLLAGSLFWPVTIGAVVGGVVAKSKDKGFDNKELGSAADDLPENSSAVVAVVKNEWVKESVDAMNTLGADVRYDDLPDELVALYSDLGEDS